MAIGEQIKVKFSARLLGRRIKCRHYIAVKKPPKLCNVFFKLVASSE